MLEQKIKLPYMDSARVADEIGRFVIDKVLSHGKSGCVIGLSGGVDSTTTAALIKRAFVDYNVKVPDTPLELVGYVLPSSVNNPADAEDGIKVAERLGIRYEVRSIEDVVQAFRTTNPDSFTSDPAGQYHRGNLMSEIRAVVLHQKAATESKTLAGTGNKDEDFGVGFYTLFGDGAVHFSPIGGLSKRLVRQMATYLGFSNIADREPDAGLEPGATDFRALGYSYDVVELVTEGLTQGLTRDQLYTHSQIVPLVEKEIALYASKFGRSKFSSVQGVVDDVWTRHEYVAKPKAAIMSPEMAPVTLEYR